MMNNKQFKEATRRRKQEKERREGRKKEGKKERKKGFSAKITKSGCN